MFQIIPVHVYLLRYIPVELSLMYSCDNLLHVIYVIIVLILSLRTVESDV